MNPVSGLASYISRSREDILPKILWQMKHRATCGYTLYTECGDICVCRDVENFKQAKAAVCLRFQGETPLLPIHGEIYEPERFELKNLRFLLVNGCFDKAAEVLRSVDGAYSILLAGEDEMILIRDHLGQKPLYYAQTPDFIAAASERVALEAFGFKALEVPKASILYLSYNEKQTHPIKVKQEQEEASVENLDEAAERVAALLERSVRARVRRYQGIVLGFSGGLDSAILAKLAACEKGVRLLCIGLKGSKDLEWGAKAANLLGLDLELYIINVEAVKSADIICRTKSNSNLIDLSLSVGVELMARRAREESCQSLMLGQLADELFGGYMRYQRAYRVKGLEAAQNLMREDILSLQRGLERDEYASAPYVDLCLPYASKHIVEYALKINPRLKVNANQRKIVLRRAAEILNLPKEIVEVPKKALQYSTGIYKVIKAATRKPYNTSTP